MPNGTIVHAEVFIGDSRIMIGEAGTGIWQEEMPSTSYVYVNDVDEVYANALQAGAISVREPVDQFYGDRTAAVRDPVGNVWTLAQLKKRTVRGEQSRRMAIQAEE